MLKKLYSHILLMRSTHRADTPRMVRRLVFLALLMAVALIRPVQAQTGSPGGFNPFTVLSTPRNWGKCTPILFCQARPSSALPANKPRVSDAQQMSWCRLYALELLRRGGASEADLSLIFLSSSWSNSYTRDDLVLLLRDVRDAQVCTSRWAPVPVVIATNLSMDDDPLSTARAQLGGGGYRFTPSEVQPDVVRPVMWLDPIGSYYDRSAGRLFNPVTAVATDVLRYPLNAWGTSWGLNTE